MVWYGIEGLLCLSSVGLGTINMLLGLTFTFHSLPTISRYFQLVKHLLPQEVHALRLNAKLLNQIKQGFVMLLLRVLLLSISLAALGLHLGQESKTETWDPLCSDTNFTQR